MATNPTILELVQAATDELILPRLTTLVGNTDASARLMLALVNRQGRALAKAKEGEGWTILQRLHTFTTVSGNPEYDPPTDFERLIIDTVWDRSTLMPMTGPILPATWQVIKSGLIGAGLYYRRYRFARATSGVAKKIVIDPTPSTTGDTLAFEYLSDAWVALASLASVSFQVLNDTDVLLLDRDLMVMGLKWRWRQAHGFDVIADLAEYNEMLDQKKGEDTPASALNLAGSAGGIQFIGWRNIPESGYG